MGSIPLLTNIGTIHPFRGAPAEDIQEWITQFNWIANINQWTEDVRCALLPGYLEDVAKIWYSTLSVRDRGNYQTIQDKLLQAFQQVIIPSSTSQPIAIKDSIRTRVSGDLCL